MEPFSDILASLCIRVDTESGDLGLLSTLRRVQLLDNLAQILDSSSKGLLGGSVLGCRSVESALSSVDRVASHLGLVEERGSWGWCELVTTFVGFV